MEQDTERRARRRDQARQRLQRETPEQRELRLARRRDQYRQRRQRATADETPCRAERAKAGKEKGSKQRTPSKS